MILRSNLAFMSTIASKSMLDSLTGNVLKTASLILMMLAAVRFDTGSGCDGSSKLIPARKSPGTSALS